jgi:cytochrome c553
MRFACRLLVVTLTVTILSATSDAAEPSHPIVAGFERFFVDPKVDLAAGGRLLLGELNCVSCHQAVDSAANRKQAPILDNVGSRVRVGWLRRYLSDPAAAKPGTTMPHLLAGIADKKEKVEALVQFLASTGSVRHERPDLKAMIVGRDHYQKLGCAACHGPRDGKTLAPYFVPLGDILAKYSVPSLAAFLEKPHSVRPSGRMPSLVNAKEARELAQHLLQGLKVDLPPKGSTLFAYYEGAFDKLPDFAKARPELTGTSPAFDVGIARRGSNYAIRFEGHFQVEKDGNYKFHLGSDDGSRLWVDDQLVVDNDGIHPPQFNQGRAYLTKGVHKVVVGFFQAGGGAELTVEIEGNGIARQGLTSLVASTAAGLKQPVSPPKQNNDDSIDLKPELIAQGKQLFGSLGCASCHTLTMDKKPLASTLSAPKLDQLKGQGGCLDAATKSGVPNYSLSATQRTALAKALTSPAKKTASPADVVAQTMTTFNCYACHSRNGIGGPEQEWNKVFLTTQPEMGDEGRVPPPLDGVGAKLNGDYLTQLLDRGADDRPYMHTRMPGFGTANVGHLTALFASLDKLPAAPKVNFTDPASKVKSAGRHLVGSNGLSCIKCHTFAGNKAEGVQGIDMLAIPKRVRQDWFYAYLLDPQKVRPGTRMPSAWYDGKSPLPKVLDGQTDAQIEAIWLYLSDSKPVLPIGLKKQSIPLTPIGEAVIYRNFIEGAGPRAIGVGYPEKAHLAFDANDCRLAMIWHGEFIDAGRHWNDRGVGFEPPLGDNVVHLPGGSAFAVLDKPDAPWPTESARQLGAQFQGYRTTTDERPTFLYAFRDVRIEDFPSPVAMEKSTGLRRTLSLSAANATDGLHYRAAVGTKIVAGSDGWFVVDGLYRVKVTGGKLQVRQSNGKTELLLSVKFADGSAKIVHEYSW